MTLVHLETIIGTTQKGYILEKLSRVRTGTILEISVHVRTREKVFRFFMTDDSMTLKTINSSRTAYTRAVREEFQETAVIVSSVIAFLYPFTVSIKSFNIPSLLFKCKDTKFLRQIQIFRRKNATLPNKRISKGQNHFDKAITGGPMNPKASALAP